MVKYKDWTENEWKNSLRPSQGWQKFSHVQRFQAPCLLSPLFCDLETNFRREDTHEYSLWRSSPHPLHSAYISTSMWRVDENNRGCPKVELRKAEWQCRAFGSTTQLLNGWKSKNEWKAGCCVQTVPAGKHWTGLFGKGETRRKWRKKINASHLCTAVIFRKLQAGKVF